jgi:lysophospholipase L1-like esterase
LGDLIINYAKQTPNVHPLWFSVDWSHDQKEKWIDFDHLHLTEEGHAEVGRQVAEVIKKVMGADPCGGCSKYGGGELSRAAACAREKES